MPTKKKNAGFKVGTPIDLKGFIDFKHVEKSIHEVLGKQANRDHTWDMYLGEIEASREKKIITEDPAELITHLTRELMESRREIFHLKRELKNVEKEAESLSTQLNELNYAVAAAIAQYGEENELHVLVDTNVDTVKVKKINDIDTHGWILVAKKVGL